jgi:hypothetical protein
MVYLLLCGGAVLMNYPGDYQPAGRSGQAMAKRPRLTADNRAGSLHPNRWSVLMPLEFFTASHAAVRALEGR